MANSDKNIRITTSKNKATFPNIVFTGSAAGASVITLEVLDDNTLSFTSNEGQVFSIDSNLSTGTIWAVSDISGVPILRASAGATVGIVEYGGILGIGQTNPIYKLDVKGSVGFASALDNSYSVLLDNASASGSNSLQVRSANSILLYNSGNTFYTGFKSNAAANVTYTLPTTDGSSGQFLQTNGSGTLSWATATGSGGTGSTAGVGQGGQYEMAYYPGTGLSVVGSNTFTNNTATGVVSITHTTASTDFSNGAFKVSGGVGIGGSLYVGGIGASIVGVTFSNSTITRGTWNGTAISTTYGGTGQNLGSSSGVLTISSGTVSASTTSSAIASALSDETGSGSLVFNSSPSFGTGVTTNSATFAVFNTTATTINAFGAATVLSIGASTGKATFNSTDNSTSSTTGGLVVSGGAGFAKSISIAGRLQLLNGANVTAFVSSGTGNTVYVLPATTPAIGTSVLQSDSIGNLSWVGISSSSGAATTATNIQISALGNVNSFHPVLLTPFQASSGSAVSANGTVVYNPSTDIFYTPGLAVTSGVDSSSTTTGALQVRGGIGVTGTGYFDVVRTRAIVTTGDVTIAGNLAVNGATIDFGNATTDSISFIGRVDTSILPISNNLYDLGSPALAYANASFGSSIYFTNTANTNILAFTAGATGTTLTYVLPIDTPTAGQVLAASAISGGRVTLSWEDDQTGAPAGGITTLNTLTAASQSFSTGTSGSDFNISSLTSTHTFNIPDAGSSARGFVSTGTQTFAGAKTFSSAASITDATVSTSTSSGALVVTGGVGIGGSLFVGLASRFTGSTASISSGTGALTVTGGVGIGGSLFVGAASEFEASTAAVDVGTGAVVVTGGVGIGGSLFVGNPARFSSSTAAISVGTGALTVTGGAGIAGSLYVGGVSAFASNTASISSGTGALVVSNGVGIGGSLNVASASSISGVILNSNYLSATGGTFTTILQASTIRALSGNTISFQTIDASNAAQFNNVRFAVLYGTVSSSSGTGALVVSGGTGIGGSLYVSSASQFEASTAAISVGTGALVVTGGVGIGGSLYVGGASRFTSNTAAISTGTGALTVSGGAGIAGSLWAGGVSAFTSNAVSISTGTGALVVTGGVGIGGSVFTSTSVPSSISGVVSNNGVITVGTWAGSLITAFYGGTGFNSYAVGDLLVASTGTSLAKLPASANSGYVLTSTGANSVPTWQAVPPAAASSVAVSVTALDQVFYPTIVNTNSGSGLGLSTVNTIQINAARGTFAAVGISAGTAITVVGSAPSINTNTGALQVIGGVGIGLSASIGGRLQLFNGSNYTAFVSSASGNTVYTLPATSPAIGSSVLQSTSGGVLSWVPMTDTSGLVQASGNLGDVQFNAAGNTFGSNANFNYDEDQSQLAISNFPAVSPSSQSAALKLLGVTQFWNNGSSLGTFLAINAGSGFLGPLIDARVNDSYRFLVDASGSIRINYNSGTGWTLPTSNGSSGQVLTANTNGVATWTTVSGSSGAGSGTVAVPGAQYQVAAYYHSATGASVSGSTTFTNNTATGVVNITHTTESTSTSTGALTVSGGAGIAKTVSAGQIKVGNLGYAASNVLSAFQSSVNAFNQVVIQNTNSGASASANVILNNNLSTDSTYYGEFGMNSSGFTGSGALSAANAVYLASATAPLVIGTVTSHPIRFVVNNGATDMIYIAESGTAISVFANLGLRSASDLRFWNSGNTFYAGIQGGNTAANYLLTLPTAPVGSGYSTILVDTSGNMYFAPVGSGLASTINNASTPFLRARRSLTIQFCAGYTPTSAGADSVTIKIPESAVDGITDLTYRLREFDVRVETPSTGPSRIQLEKFSGSGALTYAATGTSLIGGFGITLTGAAIYTTSVPSNSFAGSFVTSNDKLRINWTLLNATHANFSVQLTLEEV